MLLQQPIAPAATEMQLARLCHCASLAPWSRGLTLLSMWLLGAMIVLTLQMAPTLDVLADRSVGASVLLAGLAAIWAFLRWRSCWRMRARCGWRRWLLLFKRLPAVYVTKLAICAHRLIATTDSD